MSQSDLMEAAKEVKDEVLTCTSKYEEVSSNEGDSSSDTEEEVKKKTLNETEAATTKCFNILNAFGNYLASRAQTQITQCTVTNFDKALARVGKVLDKIDELSLKSLALTEDKQITNLPPSANKLEKASQTPYRHQATAKDKANQTLKLPASEKEMDAPATPEVEPREMKGSPWEPKLKALQTSVIRVKNDSIKMANGLCKVKPQLEELKVLAIDLYKNTEELEEESQQLKKMLLSAKIKQPQFKNASKSEEKAVQTNHPPQENKEEKASQTAVEGEGDDAKKEGNQHQEIETTPQSSPPHNSSVSFINTSPTRRTPQQMMTLIGVPEIYDQPTIEDIIKSSFQISHTEVKVIQRRKGKHPSVSNWLILTPTTIAKSMAMQEYIYIEDLQLKIRPFTSVQRCKNCQALGHGARRCTVLPICENCGRQHAPTTCNLPPSCVNCYNHNCHHSTSFPVNHRSSDSCCPIFRAAYTHKRNSLDLIYSPAYHQQQQSFYQGPLHPNSYSFNQSFQQNYSLNHQFHRSQNQSFQSSTPNSNRQSRGRWKT